MHPPSFSNVDHPPAHGGPGRPRLALTDAQARSLVQLVAAIVARHANETRQHRPFVHDFVRAVYHATGLTYSAAFYRKLLTAYAPGRTPSTPTIESEKRQLVHELSLRAVPREVIAPMDTSSADPAPPPTSPATDQALQEILTLQHHTIALVNGAATSAPGAGAASGLQAHNDYLRERLASVEAELATTRAYAARMAASVQEEASLAAERGRQLETLHKTVAEQTAALAAMATEMTGTRNFAMQAVDGVRGETRAVRERCAYTPFRKAPGASSQADILRFLHALFKGLHGTGYIRLNPMVLMKTGKPRRLDKTRAIDLDLFQFVLQVMDNQPSDKQKVHQLYLRDRFIFICLRESGLRASELVGARMGAVQPFSDPKS
ncbi:hypothetical protein D0T25_23845 [Duganella sp. BJB488]|uniref:hypothetical protein n=1 Tax=unclassified Duganella TaxID=2636909 RepID=UPI000E34E518|nr:MULTISPECIES: hypothetical protein [unclassified Duganella]RFP13113.1 hypothetical protein D0T26_22705 [Duganella sp. BJB489]RFP17123.1 hypothetical protein D0T25_23845 [Duganella sp. BJB488]RFP31658.1 hypothetical protein D0T24_24870 [Duganella sp. BJB480]